MTIFHILDLIKQQEINLNLSDFLLISYKIMESLANCHKKGIRHNDLNSNNILFDHDKLECTILDFELSARKDCLLTKAVKKYASFNALSGNFFTFHDDIYSIEVVLQELLEAVIKLQDQSKKYCAGSYRKVQKMLDKMTYPTLTRRLTTQKLCDFFCHTYNSLARK